MIFRADNIADSRLAIATPDIAALNSIRFGIDVFGASWAAPNDVVGPTVGRDVVDTISVAEVTP